MDRRLPGRSEGADPDRIEMRSVSARQSEVLNDFEDCIDGDEADTVDAFVFGRA